MGTGHGTPINKEGTSQRNGKPRRVFFYKKKKPLRADSRRPANAKERRWVFGWAERSARMDHERFHCMNRSGDTEQILAYPISDSARIRKNWARPAARPTRFQSSSPRSNKGHARRRSPDLDTRNRLFSHPLDLYPTVRNQSHVPISCCRSDRF
jgi:hypothetical protein